MVILKSMRLKFSTLVIVCLSGVLVFGKPPVIKSFKANRYRGFNPMSVKFTVDAYSRDGDSLSYTFHILDEQGVGTDIISETNTLVYTFSSEGNYSVRVSVFGSNNESVESDTLSIRVLSADNPTKLSVLTSRQLAKILHMDFGSISAKTVFFNDRDNNVNLNIKGYYNGEPVFESNEIILPRETFTLSEHYLVHPTTDVIVSLSAHIPVCSMVFTPEGIARAWYRFDNTIQMYVPYIDEDTAFKDTFLYISNPFVKPVAFTFNNQINELQEDYTIILDASSFVSPFIDANLCWGLIKDEIVQTLNPGFVEEKSLNGFALTVDFDDKPSMYELKESGSNTLFLPLIPGFDCYNDLVILNTGDRETEVTITFFNNHGIRTGEHKFTVNTKERLKLYLESIIINSGIEADYAVISSVQPIIGINQIKFLYGGEYSYTLPSYLECRGLSPVVLSDDYYWTAFSIINPNNGENTITFTLYTPSGKFKVSKSITVPAMGTLTLYVETVFDNVEISNGDSIVITSVKPISGLTLQGNNSLSRVSALPIF